MTSKDDRTELLLGAAILVAVLAIAFIVAGCDRNDAPPCVATETTVHEDMLSSRNAALEQRIARCEQDRDRNADEVRRWQQQYRRREVVPQEDGEP